MFLSDEPCGFHERRISSVEQASRSQADEALRRSTQSKTPSGFPPGVLLDGDQTNRITSCAERGAGGATVS